jgi:hypothetical protein
METVEVVEGWVCENPKCMTVYAEYVNGCPRCYVDEKDNNGKRVCFSVHHQRIEVL